VAAKNLADREFVAFQADVFALPFAPDSFDLIYSMECFITHRIVKRR